MNLTDRDRQIIKDCLDRGKGLSPKHRKARDEAAVRTTGIIGNDANRTIEEKM